MELVTAMAVVAIISFFALPFFSLQSTSPKAEARHFLEVLQLAQQHARQHGVRTRVVFPNGELTQSTSGELKNAYAVYVFEIPSADSSARTPELLGKWIPLDSSAEWRKIFDNVQVSYPGENDLSNLYENPIQYWSATETGYLSTNCVSSPFPSNYHQTPYRSNFYDLSGIEFGVQGMPSFQEEETRVRFFEKNNTNNSWSVIARSTGEIFLQSP